MSRRTALAIAVLAAASASPAQEAPPPVTAEQVIEAGREAYLPPELRPRPKCPMPKPGDEIVVCAEAEDPAKFRVQSSSELDPTSRRARGGGPAAPEVGTIYPGGVAARGCMIPPCPPPMPELIDLKAIPEAPPGSDADRIARGEKGP